MRNIIVFSLSLALGVGICLVQAADFDKINENTSNLFAKTIANGDTVFFPAPDESIAIPFYFKPAITSMDSILYVGYFDPNETLLVEDTTVYFNCYIAVVQNGVFIVRNSSVQIYGGLIAIQGGSIVIDSSELRLMSAYAWQFAISARDSAAIRITDSEFDYGGYPGYTYIHDNSFLFVENSNYIGTTAIYSQNARVDYINVTGSGEYSARDSSVVHFTNVEHAMIHLQVPESTSLDMDFATDTFEFVEHWEVHPSSPFVSGTGYTFIIDSSYCIFNPSCASFSELTVEDSQCDILVRFTQPVCDTISGLVNHTLYDDWLVPFDDRTIRLVNTTINSWHIQTFSTANIRVENSIIGEFICFDSSEAYLANSIHDGTGGPLTAAGNSQVFVSYSDIRPNTVKVRKNGLLVLNVCTVWEDFVVSDSGLAVLLGTFNLNPIRVFDAGAAIVASIKSPAAAVIDSDVSIIGDAYIERTPMSEYDFDAYRLSYVNYPIDTVVDIDSLEWITFTDWITHQVRNDTLAVWNTSGLETGRYFLKLEWREASTSFIFYTFYRVNLRESASLEETDISPEDISITAYPNPFNSSIVIITPVGAQIVIYDLRGRVVCEPPIPQRRDLSPLLRETDTDRRQGVIWTPDKTTPSGIYLVKARTEDGKQLSKRVVFLQ